MSKEKEIFSNLIQEIETRLMNEVGMKKLNQRVFPEKSKWMQNDWDRIAQLISDYLESAGKNNNTARVQKEAKIVSGTNINNFISSVKIGKVEFKKRMSHNQSRYYSLFISPTTVQNAWSFAENKRQEKPGKQVRHILAIFLNYFGDFNFESYFDWEDHYTHDKEDTHQLLEDIKTSLEKKDRIENNIESYKNSRYIDNVWKIISTDPIWQFYMLNIKVFLMEIFHSTTNININNPLFISITGTEGVSKTFFSYQIVKKYLLAIEHINKDIIVKMHPRNLTTENTQERKQKIQNILNDCKGGILIFDHVSLESSNLDTIVQIIHSIRSSPEHSNTAVIIMGHKVKINNFINKFFPVEFDEKHSIHFFPPTYKVLANVFERYALKHNGIFIHESSKIEIKKYFELKREISQFRFYLKKHKVLNEKFIAFKYASEIKYLLSSLTTALVCQNVVVPGMVSNCEVFQATKQEHKVIFDKYFEHRKKQNFE